MTHQTYPYWPSFFISLALHILLGLTLLRVPLFPGAAIYPQIITVEIVEMKKVLEDLKTPEKKPPPPRVLTPANKLPLAPKKEAIIEPQVQPPSHSGAEDKEEFLSERRTSTPVPPMGEEIVEAQLNLNIFGAGKEEDLEEPVIRETKAGVIELGLAAPGSPWAMEKGTGTSLIPAITGTKLSRMGESREGEGIGTKSLGPGVNPGTEMGLGGKAPKGDSSLGKGNGASGLSSYLGLARRKIEKAKRYPNEAQRRHWEGKVVLSFQITQQGDVGGIKVVESSGVPILDQEGINTIRRASPFPAPLPDARDQLEIRIPIIFKLEGK